MDYFSFFLIFFLIYQTKGQQEVSVPLNQDVTLLCQSDSSLDSISVLKWSRADLKADGYVYFYRNRRCFENYQHRRFQGRVMLRDGGMKGGDASLILKNATWEDAGLYECDLVVESRRQHSEISHAIRLTVTPAAETRDGVMDSFKQPEEEDDGRTGSRDGAGRISYTAAMVTMVTAALFVLVVGFITYKYFKRCFLKPHQRSGSENLDPQSLTKVLSTSEPEKCKNFSSLHALAICTL